MKEKMAEKWEMSKVTSNAGKYEEEKRRTSCHLPKIQRDSVLRGAFGQNVVVEKEIVENWPLQR